MINELLKTHNELSDDETILVIFRNELGLIVDTDDQIIIDGNDLKYYSESGDFIRKVDDIKKFVVVPKEEMARRLLETIMLGGI